MVTVEDKDTTYTQKGKKAMKYSVYATEKSINKEKIIGTWGNSNDAMTWARIFANSLYWINVRIELKPNKG